MKRVSIFNILSTLFRVCFAMLCSSIGTKLTPRGWSEKLIGSSWRMWRLLSSVSNPKRLRCCLCCDIVTYMATLIWTILSVWVWHLVYVLQTVEQYFRLGHNCVLLTSFFTCASFHAGSQACCYNFCRLVWAYHFNWVGFGMKKKQQQNKQTKKKKKKNGMNQPRKLVTPSLYQSWAKHEIA